LADQRVVLEEAGVDVYAVVKEAIPEEISGFVPKFWPEDRIYLDEDMVCATHPHPHTPLPHTHTHTS